MLARAFDLPTAEIPTEVEEFIYTTKLFLRGEKVHLFEEPYYSGYSICVLTNSGLLVDCKGLIICQKKYFTKNTYDTGKRYLGTGIIHTMRA